MGVSANEMVRKASEAIISGNLNLAHEVIREDDNVDRLERELTLETVTVVMQETPVASDLRHLVATLGVISEIEKVGDHAVKLARRGIKLQGFFPGTLKLALSELSEQARVQFASSIKLYSEYNAELAQRVVESDEMVDNAYSDARNRVMEAFREDQSHLRQMVRTIEVFHALEHVADQAVAIAKRMQVLHDGRPEN